MRGRPGLLAVSLLGSLVSAAAAAVAMPSSSSASSSDAPVVLLGTAEDEPLTGRIAAELRALGIGIEIRVIAGDERIIEVEVASALREGARAAVRIDAQAGRTEVSVADPITRRVALRQVLEGPPTATLAPVLAVRTVEFVRATLLGNNKRKGSGPASDTNGDKVGDDRGNEPEGVGPGEVSAEGGTIAREPRAEEPERGPLPLAPLAFALDSGVVVTGQLPSQVVVGIVARIRLASHVGLEVMAFTPLTNARLDDSQTSTRASTWLGGADLFARQPLGSRAGIELGGGALAALMQTTGSVTAAMPKVVGGTDWAWGGSVYGRLAGDVALSRAVALRLELLGGAAFLRNDIPVYDADGVSRSTKMAWGSTFVTGLGGVEARWF